MSKLKLLNKILFLFFYPCIVQSLEDSPIFYPCFYLDTELVRKINKNEVKSVFEIGSSKGVNAINLYSYYNCPIFIYEPNLQRKEIIYNNIKNYPGIRLLDSLERSVLLRNSTVESIDMLCIDVPEGLFGYIKKFNKYLKHIKYIIVKKSAINVFVKNYLNIKQFKSYFDNSSFFDYILFINKKIIDTSIDLEVYSTPLLEPMISGNINSELIYAAWADDHSIFHDLSGNTDLDINYQDSNGNTALIMAIAKRSSYPLQKLMQQKNLDFGLQTNNGTTPLMVAVTLNDPCLIDLILKDERCRKTVRMINNLGMTAEDIANSLNYLEITEMLRLVECLTQKQTHQKKISLPLPILSEKVLICGTCRNVSSYLPDTIKMIEMIGNLFSDYKVLIYENNSTDKTKDILLDWMNENSRVCVQLEDLTKQDLENIVINIHDSGDFFKVDLIARARNILLDKAMQDDYDEYPIIIMIDMDFSQPPNLEAIIEVFKSKQQWDAVFAYGVSAQGTYWDWYAFRDFNQPLGPELIGSDWFVSKKWFLNRNDQWCKVYSAFGGLGIYKKSSIRGCRYSSVVTKDLEEVFKRVISVGGSSGHPVVLKYLNDIKAFPKINILSLAVNLPRRGCSEFCVNS